MNAQDITAPPVDNDHVAEGAERFPEPAAPALTPEQERAAGQAAMAKLIEDAAAANPKPQRIWRNFEVVIREGDKLKHQYFNANECSVQGGMLTIFNVVHNAKPTPENPHGEAMYMLAVFKDWVGFTDMTAKSLKKEVFENMTFGSDEVPEEAAA